MPNEALIVVDMQNDFCDGGALAVPGANAIVPLVNRLIGRFDHVVMTQDWHPAKHVSFASSHNKKPFSMIDMPYGKQVMWPVHWVQGTSDALKELHVTKANMILRKGFNPDVDGYSAFFDNDHKTSTDLEGYFKTRGVKHIFLAGLATDFCVMWSSLDARKLGFEATVIEDACRGIDLDGSLAAAWKSMEKAGVGRVNSSDLGTT